MAVSRDPAFRTVRMRESYDLDAVDDFVDRVIDALEGRPGGRSITPEKIEAQEFKVVRLREGYSMDDVDDWLDEAAAELRRIRAAGGARRPAARPEPPRVEPSYEQVGAPTNAYGAPPVAPPPVAYPVPEPQQPYQDSGYLTPHQADTGYHQADTGYHQADTGYHQPGLDTAFHQLDPALQQLDPAFTPAVTGRPDAERPVTQVSTPTTGLHHLEIWVRDLEIGVTSFGWLFERLGWTLFQAWDNGRSWQAPGDGPYVVIERSPDMTWTQYDRKAPGLNHLALAVPERWMVDRIVSEAATYGWRLLFADRHPYAGGTQHYAAYLENEEGFEVEVVAP
ncbi:MAG TPA: DivIVA domain-containing protein [Jiangellaceae bacterium]